MNLLNGSRRRRSGVTLIELLVVIAIIGILISLLFPAVMRARGASLKAACANNLKQLGGAVQTFHARHGSLPTYWGAMNGMYGGWLLHLLPDLGEQAFYDALPRGENVPRLAQIQDVLVSPYVPPSSDYNPGEWIIESYTVNEQVQTGVTSQSSTSPVQVQVGTTTRQVTQTEQVQVGTTTKQIQETERVQVGTTTRQYTERVQTGTQTQVNFVGIAVEVPVYEDQVRTVEEPVYENRTVTRTVEEPVFESRTVTRTIEEPVYETQQVTSTVSVPVYTTVTKTLNRERLVNQRGTPEQPPVYDYRWAPTGQTDAIGIPSNFGAAQSVRSLTVLQCLADPSNVPADFMLPVKNSTSGTNNWSLTNYQASAHAFVRFGNVVVSGSITRGPGGRILSTLTTGSNMGGRFPRPQGPNGGAAIRTFAHHDVIGTGTANSLTPRKFDHMSDGATNTILFGEGMRQCDGGNSFRIAFLPTADAGNEHAFGMDLTITDPATGALMGTDTFGGYGNTLMFQMRPGLKGCNKFRLQSNHEDVLNVAMADGSVRGISAGVSRRELLDPDVAGRRHGGDGLVYGPVSMGGKPGADYFDGVWDMLLMPNDGADQVLLNTGEVGKEK